MSIKEKVAQIQSMERELEETRAAAVKEAIAEVQTLINLFNITASDVRFPEPGAKPRAKRSAGPVMYAFGDKTWTAARPTGSRSTRPMAAIAVTSSSTRKIEIRSIEGN